MKQIKEEDFIPYGTAWENQVRKLSKEQLIKMIVRIGKERDDLISEGFKMSAEIEQLTELLNMKN